MNNPTYKISGLERRKIKKELAQLKLFYKDFWHYHQLEKDMVSLYSPNHNYIMSDNDAQKLYDKTNKKIKSIEKDLSQLL
jgi:hypothetical protein